jgi:hypothetical protein
MSDAEYPFEKVKIMDNFREIDNLTRLTRKREFDDGLVDILYGGVFLVWGLASWFLFSAVGFRWFVIALTRQREITIIALLALAPAFILVIYGLRRLIERIRRSYLWKDSGYVEPLRWQVKKSVSITAGFMSIALILVAVWLMANGVLSEEGALRALAASASLGTSVVYLGMGIDLRIRRYVVVGIAGVILTGFVMSQWVSFAGSWLLVGVGWLAILVVSGLWALRQSMLSLAESPSA